VRSALTQRVNSIEVKNINFHNGLVKIISGQLRNLGLMRYTWMSVKCSDIETLEADGGAILDNFGSKV
jgi:hypothetical protein